jgi:hypothetical protein
MLTKLADTTAASSLGLAAGHKLLRVSAGNWINRRVALFMSAPHTIALSWSDSPYLSWALPVPIITDSEDSPFDAVIEAGGDLIVAYTDQATSRLVSRRRTITSTGWTVGAKVTVYDGAFGYDPNLLSTLDGKLWLAWRRQVVPSSWIHVKSLSDGGAVWGSGPTDTGEQLSDASTFISSRLAVDSAQIHLFLAYGNSRLVVRSYPLGGGAWTAESTVYTSAGVGGEFDVAVTDTGGLAIVVCDPLPRYREFDGFAWGPVTQLDSRASSSPQLMFRDSNPVIIFLAGIGPNQTALFHTARVGGAFLPSSYVDRRARTFDRVLLYNSASASYQDVTSGAADSNTGDVVHPQSGATLTAIGDRIFVGLEDNFRFLTILLSVNGTGGTAQYSYWDGSGWKTFTPLSGGSNLAASINQMILWSDHASIPRDWQKTTVNTHRLFWLKIECTSDFVVAPVGYQLTAVSDLQQLIARR